MYFFSESGAWAKMTSASPLPAIARACPVPTASALITSTIAVPGGASNALETPGGTDNVDTLYVLGEGSPPGTLAQGQLFSCYLTPINLTNNTAGSPINVSDSSPGQPTKMIIADNNTLWLGGVRCTEGQRYATGQPYGCLTMFNTSNDTVTMLEPYLGDATGIAAVTGLNKIYTAEGGQVYIYTTTDGTAINNFYVTVTGTAYDVAYMDADTDADNTVY